MLSWEGQTMGVDEAVRVGDSASWNGKDAAKRMNRPVGLLVGAIGVFAGAFVLLGQSPGVNITWPLAVAFLGALVGGSWLWLVRSRTDSRFGLSGSVIAWGVLAALCLSAIASALFALQDSPSEWTVVVIVLALITMGSVAILTAVLLGLLGSTLFNANRGGAQNVG